MIDQDKRKAIFLLHREGMKIRDISFRLKVSRNTVRSIIKQSGRAPESMRGDKIMIEQKLLVRLYDECAGRIQRIHEKLAEEEGVKIGYSTLSRLMRELGLTKAGHSASRCCRVPDEPGAEMQQDTSPYTLPIGGKNIKVIGSILYFRYSKMRYLKFYRSFDRFKMKCFFHEAITFFGYSARVCIIDNTNLARLRGSGKNALIAPEMEQFARQFGFCYVCHELNHPNRKAGNERSFYTAETNFFPGRSFESMEDLNQKALEWATVRMANRPVSKSGLIPAKAFEHEKLYLVKLPPFVPPPYLIHKRDIDQYGYVSFDGNFYWVPGTLRGEALCLQYSHDLKIYLAQKLLAEYRLPPWGVKNQLVTPCGVPKPEHKPKNRKEPTAQEEKKLRALDKDVDAYLEFALKSKKGKEKHKVIREMFGLYQKITLPLFIKTIKRALCYRITDLRCVERIALLYLTGGEGEIGPVQIDEEFQKRPAYLEGRLSDEADLSVYEKLLEDVAVVVEPEVKEDEP
jgi:transposase